MLVSPALFRRLTCAVALVSAVVIFAAPDARRPFGLADFDGWRSIDSETLSRDGRWLAYSFMPLEGDGDLVLRELATGRELCFPVGALPPPPLTASEENPERPSPRREVTIALTSDARFAIATAFPAQADTLAAKRAKKKPAELPKEGLVIVDLATGNATRLADVKNFQVPAKGGSWLAYLKEPAAEKKDDAAKPAATKTKEKKYGSPLVLRDLATGNERTFADVLDYSFARDGRTLVFTVSSRNETGNGVYAVTPGDPSAPLALASGPGRYQKFTWDRTQSQAAFVTDRAEPDARVPRFALWHWTRGTAPAAELVTAATPGVPTGWSVSGDAAPAFSFDGRKLYVSTAPVPPPPDERLESLLDEEKITADLWRWNDDYIQPLQKIRAGKDRTRAYLGVLDLPARTFRQVADLTLPTVTFSDDGERAFGLDDRAYRRRLDYAGLAQDLYVVEATTGTRTLLVRELGEKAGLRWSHTGRWFAYYHQRQWFVVDAQTGETRSLTAQLPVAFHDEDSDVIEEPGAYGIAGWMQDGESFLAYDRFDVWQLFADGRPARNLTAGAGRAEKIQFRLQNIRPVDPDDARRGIDPAEPLILRAESEETRASGFYRATFTATTVAAPERLLWGDKNYRFVNRARDADTLLLTASRFDEYPDLATTNTAFAAPVKVTAGGAQLERYLWGQSELLTYRNADGRELRALLCKPANFDPTKKYPLIVYLYERLSQTLHTFTTPVPATYLNPAYYTSNGYVVLMPDIVYTAGQPGQSALKCVLPAVDEVVRHGFVDEKSIGISGHSWGGYQIAYMLTQTDRFRAAEAGAAVGNMTSAYSGIRWGSGRARQFQYEKTQSRIGPPLVAAPQLYLENSPVFHIDRVTTPLLLINNDQDDAVPFEQGIELFLALRRHGKEAYFFNYNGEFHGLRRRADQKDWVKRMHQFFDHFLKGSPAPAWMTDGIPYLDREAEKLRFRDTP
jgi:dipeptidyl aminopeptidase/acylaminoacyl peptidase